MKLHYRLLAAALAFFFAVIALGFTVTAGWFHSFDIAVAHALNLEHGRSPEWLINVMWWISWTCGGAQRYIFIAMLSVVLWRWWGWIAGVAMGAAAWLSNYTSETLKLFFARARPDLVPHLDPQSNFSYPSGHSTSAAVVYILFIMLVPQARHPVWQVMAAALIILTGISRINMGVHWATDVIGGWMLGASFALLAGAIIAWREHQRGSAFPSVLTPEESPHAEG